MKTAIATLAVAGLAAALDATYDADLDLFNKWKSQHGKQYETLEHEMTKFNTFKANAAAINEHNMREGNTVTLALNHLADLNQVEYKNLLLGSGPAPARTGIEYLQSENVEIPESVDWRKEGYVTPVKNQGQCGSCWAFSTIAATEGQYFRKYGKLVSLSEQQLVDCSTENSGCGGGLMDKAFDYIHTLKEGVDTEESYPYEEAQGKCRASKGVRVTPAATVRTHVDIPEEDEHALTNAIATQGPVSVAIDASSMAFQFYSTGVFEADKCGEQLDHGVTAVGYGTESVPAGWFNPARNVDYYLVKNSWGASWGDDGYIKIARNACGITLSASYPLM